MSERLEAPSIVRAWIKQLCAPDFWEYLAIIGWTRKLDVILHANNGEVKLEPDTLVHGKRW